MANFLMEYDMDAVLIIDLRGVTKLTTKSGARLTGQI